MKRRMFVAAFALCLSLLGQGHPALAAEEKSQNDLYDQLIQQGWKVASPGVLQRTLGAGKVETLGFGEEGLRFKLETLRSQLAFLREEYRHRPSPEIRRSIRAQRTQIARVLEALDTAKAAEEIDFITAKAGIDCTIKYGAHVNAFPLTSGQGVGANTDSYFNSNCGQTGEVYAHAFGRATGADNVIRTFSKSDPTTGPSLPRIGGNVTASAGDTVLGVKDCYSYSYASMTSYDIGVTYEQSATNYTCPAAPPTVTINGTTATFISGFTCKTITWTSTVSGGTPGYTYTWYRDGYQVGTGTSYAETFCGDNITWTEYVNLSLNVRDAANQTGSDTHTATINYSGTSTCDPYSTIRCPQEPL